MRLAASYSFKGGQEKLTAYYPNLLAEINCAIEAVDANRCKSKKSKEKTMPGRMLYSPKAINKCFKRELGKLDWEPVRIPCDYPTTYYVTGYEARSPSKGAFREMDFVKERVGIEVQFGKYAFMVYNVCAKMTIFRNLGHIDFGVEIVPVKGFASEMSSGVSYFEQFVWDLESRGIADIDTPVLILGIDG